MEQEEQHTSFAEGQQGTKRKAEDEVVVEKAPVINREALAQAYAPYVPYEHQPYDHYPAAAGGGGGGAYAHEQQQHYYPSYSAPQPYYAGGTTTTTTTSTTSSSSSSTAGGNPTYSYYPTAGAQPTSYGGGGVAPQPYYPVPPPSSAAPPVVVQISPQPAKKPPGASGGGAASVVGGPAAKIVYRKAAGKSWEDATLAEWPENDFRIFVGDIGNEVNDEILKSAFSKYPSFQRSKVVRDPKSLKTKGYGFVSFSDARDYVKALREMNGKYIGNRPVKLRKSTWKQYTDEEKAQSVQQKQLQQQQQQSGKGKGKGQQLQKKRKV